MSASFWTGLALIAVLALLLLLALRYYPSSGDKPPYR